MGELHARRGQLRTPGVVGACAPAVEEVLRVGGVSREEARGRGSRSASRLSPARLGGPARPGEGGAPLPLDDESKGRANTPAGCARSVGFAADLRRGSLCGVQIGCRRARMWRAVHTSGATAVCGARVGHGAGRETRSGPSSYLGTSWNDRLCVTGMINCQTARLPNCQTAVFQPEFSAKFASRDKNTHLFQTVVSGLGSSGMRNHR